MGVGVEIKLINAAIRERRSTAVEGPPKQKALCRRRFGKCPLLLDGVE
jgi:hypothetical protein